MITYPAIDPQVNAEYPDVFLLVCPCGHQSVREKAVVAEASWTHVCPNCGVTSPVRNPAARIRPQALTAMVMALAGDAFPTLDAGYARTQYKPERGTTSPEVQAQIKAEAIAKRVRKAAKK